MMIRNILCYGASNTWGFIPNSFDMKILRGKRYERHQRWPGILQQQLGDNYYIIEESLNGRTTIYDDFLSANRFRNGLAYLPLCLDTHYPLDLVICMLGTNDTKVHFNKSVKEIAAGMQQIVNFIKSSTAGRNGVAPEFLLIAPQPMTNVALKSDFFDETSITKSVEIPAAFQEVADMEKIHFLNSGDYVESSKLDGYHLDEAAHAILGRATTEKVKEIFEN